MRKEDALMDMTSASIVAITAMIAILFIVLNLSPATVAESGGTNTLSQENMAGKAVTYETCVPVGESFDTTPYDYNNDGILDYYDFTDCLAGTVEADCDLNNDGVVDSVDEESFNLLVRRLYDYNNNLALDREDPSFLKEVILGNRHCDENHACDLDGDGFVCKKDLTLFTSLLYNYENP